MSKYYTLVNYTEEERISPHEFDRGEHLGGWFREASNTIAMYLLVTGSNQTGEYAGRWSGDNIALVSDSMDIDTREYTDISSEVFDEMNREVEGFPEEMESEVSKEVLGAYP